jgi:hypothetical protein
VYLIYQPAGDAEPQRFKYQPTKIMSAEREYLERRSGKDFTAFTTAVLQGNSLCRRALLHVMLKRRHPTLKWDDVDFAWDELRLEYSRQELEAMRAAHAESTDPQAAATVEALDAEIAAAIDEDEDPGAEGKARLPIAG